MPLAICSTWPAIFFNPRLLITQVAMLMIWRPDMRDCPIRISRDPSPKHVCSAIRELHYTFPARRTNIAYLAFSAEAITCERCHGSAEKHLSDPRAGTIINPAKLEPAARDSICEQCHLLGVGRVLNPGKKFSDFRPGQSLEDVFTTYRNCRPQPVRMPQKFKVISHVEQLARSTCARKSDGRLWCGTCHDPHNKPAEPVEFFRSKCLSCHMEKFPASHPDKESNCIGCHMPRRDAKDGGHTAFTDHRIQRRPEVATNSAGNTDIAAWREPAPDLQKRNLGIAYVNVGAERRSPPFIVRGYRMLTEVQEQFSADSAVFTAMGTALLLGKHRRRRNWLSIAHCNSIRTRLRARPMRRQPSCKAGDIDKAVAHLERAVAMDPLHLPADMPLIDLYKRQGNTAKAAELADKVVGCGSAIIGSAIIGSAIIRSAS